MQKNIQKIISINPSIWPRKTWYFTGKTYELKSFIRSCTSFVFLDAGTTYTEIKNEINMISSFTFSFSCGRILHVFATTRNSYTIQRGSTDVCNVRNWYSRCTSSITIFFLVELSYIQCCVDGSYIWVYVMVSLL